MQMWMAVYLTVNMVVKVGGTASVYVHASSSSSKTYQQQNL